MTTISPTRSASRADYPSNSSHHNSADFARQIVFAEFRPRDAKAILQADFLDRPPAQFPVPVPDPAPEVGLP